MMCFGSSFLYGLFNAGLMERYSLTTFRQMHYGMKDEEVQYVIKVVNKFYR